jgi:hypothetical protein
LGRPQLKDRDQLSRFNFRRPPARLLAMMFLNMAVGARALMVWPWRMATVRAVVLSRRAVMIPSGSGTDGAVIEEDVDIVLRRQQGDDMALENEVRAVGALDGLGDLWVGGVEQIADLA